MEPSVVWGLSPLAVGGLDCRDVIVEKPCIAGAQPRVNVLLHIPSQSPWGFPDLFHILLISIEKYFRRLLCTHTMAAWYYSCFQICKLCSFVSFWSPACMAWVCPHYIRLLLWSHRLCMTAFSHCHNYICLLVWSHRVCMAAFCPRKAASTCSWYH